MSRIILCGSCGKRLTNDQEIEFSKHLSEFFCNSKCATDRYFSVMESAPVDFSQDELPLGVRVAGKVLVQD